jgi:hypothetical protein
MDLPEEVAMRPDVLVIESGEILLPGKVKMGNIGLPKGVAYACLAETTVLALEGRFENFTVGHDIEWEKVVVGRPSRFDAPQGEDSTNARAISTGFIARFAFQSFKVISV